MYLFLAIMTLTRSWEQFRYDYSQVCRTSHKQKDIQTVDPNMGHRIEENSVGQ